MRKCFMTIVAAVALLVTAGPMAAQDTSADLQDDAQYEPTQPGADSQAPQGSQVIQGTVEEVNEDQLTLRTSTGVQHIQIVDQTLYPSNLEPGTKVAVDYNRTTSGVMIAQQIRLDTGETTMAEQGRVDMATEPATTTSRSDFDTDVDAEADTDIAADTTTEFDDTETTMAGDELPRTGGELPLIALLGLIGLAGAGALHLLRS